MRRGWLGLLLALLVAAVLVFGSVATSLAAIPDDPDFDPVTRRFGRTRSITVEVYDRGNPGGSPPEDNAFTDFIKEGMLRDHNVRVTFVPIPRGTEVEVINARLAAGDAPDVAVTYRDPTVQTYANMGGVIDLAPYLEKYKDVLPNLWELLGDTNIYWNRDPNTGRVWAIEALLFQNKRINTFVREDWLKKLGLPEPRTLEEFENMLRAFRDNAELLLGPEMAHEMIPFSISQDVGWRADHLLMSFVPESLTDKEMFIYGFDDRHFLFPGYKEGVRKLNQWYHEGLIWPDFALYPPGDPTEDNNMKKGVVGAFIHNWDYPYRNGEDSIHVALQRLVGPEAAFIAVEPFPNDAGIYRKFLSAPVDRKIFFPITNKEPLASLLYLDWISKLENRRFLQIGAEGVNHVALEDGAGQLLAATGDMSPNSTQNIDYTITIHGLDLGDPELTAKSIALNYPGVDARIVERAYHITSNEARYNKNFQVGEIRAEEGMQTALADKRDRLLQRAIVARPEDF